ncbi:MAG: MATE family efflux transporter [Clostridiales bacterium]|nr:MATE family efflux transporter [Clostridiales bacterium]
MQTEFSRKSALKMIFALAWPTVLEQILITAVSYVDTAMVGRYSDNASAIVGCTMTVNWLIGGIVSAIAVGFLSLIARAVGAGEKDLVRKAAAQATGVALIVGVLLSIIILPISRFVPVWMNADPSIQKDAGTYFFIIYTPMIFRSALIIYGTVLRAAGDTKTPMVVNTATNIVNMVLNFFMIYETRALSVFGMNLTIPGMNLGTTGAATASAISFVVGGVWMTIAVYRSKLLSPRGMSLKPDPAILKPCFRVAFPALLQRIATSSGYVAFSGMINTLGEVATGAHTIANTAESAFYIPGYGMQAAASTLIGMSLGEKNPKKMKSICHMLLIIEVLVMILSGGALFFGAEAIMRIFTKSEEIIKVGTTVLMMVAISEPAYGIGIIIEGIFHGVGDTMSTFIFGALGMWGVRILGTYVFVVLLGHGLVAAWACMIAHNLVLSLLLSIRYIRGKWNPLRGALQEA